jgi:hypothetical protein
VVAIALGAVVLFSDPGFIGFISSWIADNCF